jgi:hypothetical protein
VFLQPEDAAVVKTNAFKNAVTIEQPVIEHRDFGCGFFVESSVDIDLHGGLVNQ